MKTLKPQTDKCPLVHYWIDACMHACTLLSISHSIYFIFLCPIQAASKPEPDPPLESTPSNETSTPLPKSASITSPPSTATATSSKSKRKSISAISTIKQASISKKIPPYLSRSSKGGITYFTLVHEAIVDLADRTGSSVPAIEKYIHSKHSELETVNPKMFHNGVLTAVKSAVKDGKLLKVKCSYKVNKDWVNKEKKVFQAKEAKKKVAERKKKKDAEDEKKKKEALKKEKEKAAEKAAAVAKGSAVKELKSPEKVEDKMDPKLKAEFEKKMGAASTDEDREKVAKEMVRAEYIFFCLL
jgi:histone H1/5